MTIATARCTAPKDGVPFSERCDAPASWTCPLGPRCGMCAAREMAAIAAGGERLVAVLAEEEARERGADESARERPVMKYKLVTRARREVREP